MSRACIALYGLVLLLVVGCNQTPFHGGVTRTSYPKSIVSLSPGGSEIIASNFGLGSMKGRTAACDYPKTLSRVPIVAETKPNFERIAEIEPDLIVYDADLLSNSDVEKLREETGAGMVALDATTLDEYFDDLFDLAKYMNSETATSSMVDQIESARSAARARPVSPTPKVAVIMPGGAGEHFIVGVNSFQADVVRAASGQPVGPDAKNFVKLNAEWLVQANPDIIVTAGSPDAILADKRFSSLTAVKKGNVVGVVEDVLLRRGWRVDKLVERLYVIFAESVAK